MWDVILLIPDHCLSNTFNKKKNGQFRLEVVPIWLPIPCWGQQRDFQRYVKIHPRIKLFIHMESKFLKTPKYYTC